MTVEHKHRRQPSSAWTWSGCVVIGLQLWADLVTVCIQWSGMAGAIAAAEGVVMHCSCRTCCSCKSV